MQQTFMPIEPLTACERQREDEVRVRFGLVLGISILMGGSACVAQNAPISFKQLEWNGEPLLRPAKIERAEISALSAKLASGSFLTSSPADPIVRRFPVTRAPDKPRLGAGFFLLNGLNLGMTGLDIGLSQHCIAEHRCREANLLMPSSLAARISIVAAFAALGAYVSHRMKVRGNRLWWAPPLFGTVAHGVGVVSGLVQ